MRLEIRRLRLTRGIIRRCLYSSLALLGITSGVLMATIETASASQQSNTVTIVVTDNTQGWSLADPGTPGANTGMAFQYNDSVTISACSSTNGTGAQQLNINDGAGTFSAYAGVVNGTGCVSGYSFTANNTQFGDDWVAYSGGNSNIAPTSSPWSGIFTVNGYTGPSLGNGGSTVVYGNGANFCLPFTGGNIGGDNWSGSGAPPGMSYDGNNCYSGAPNQPGQWTGSISDTEYDGAGYPFSTAGSWTVTANTAGPSWNGGQPGSATATLNVGNSNFAQFSASSGDASGISYSASSLPSGVSINSSNGVVSGTPTTSGTFSGPVYASNDGGTVSTNFTLTVDSAASAPTSANAVTFTTGQSGSFTVTTNGSDYPVDTLSETGALPSGLGFVNNGNGTATLRGTPSAGSGGSYPLTIHTSNSTGSATQNFNLTVNQAPSFVSSSSDSLPIGAPFTFGITATGFPAPTVTESGTLPAGVTFSHGVLSGTPLANTLGTYPISFTASNGVGSAATQSFTLIVGQAPAITSASSTTFTIAKASTFTVLAPGGSPTAALSESGTLPAGVTFVDNGDGTATLSGTPNPGTGGTYALSITANNGVGSPAVQPLDLTVDSGPAITSTSTATFSERNPGAITITSNAVPRASFAESGSLPPGVTFTDNGNGTASIAGTPAAGTVGTYTVAVTASNGTGTPTTQGFTLIVDQANGIAFTSSATAIFVQGTAAAFAVTAVATPSPTFAAIGLPPGLTITAASGAISGIPTTPGFYPVTITAANGVDTQVTTLAFTVASASVGLSGSTSLSAIVGQPLSAVYQATSVPTASFSIIGTLPAGLSFIDAGDGSASITGSPTAGAQGSTVTITANDGNGISSVTVTITVKQPPQFSSMPNTSFTVGQAGSFSITTTGAAQAITEIGSLPSGLSFVDNGDGTGTISGTPAANTSKVYPVYLTASNATGPTTVLFNLTVDDVPAITSAPACTMQVGTSSSCVLTSYGEPVPNFSLISGQLPSGLNLLPRGELAGVPSTGTGGTYHLGLEVTNAIGTGTQAFTLTINEAPSINSATTGNWYAGITNSFTVKTYGFPAASLSESGSLPSGLSFVDNGNDTATIWGITAATGSFPVTITASNGIGTPRTQSFTLIVSAAVAPAITSASSATFTTGTAGTFTVTSIGAPLPDLNVSGLVSGLSVVDNGDGTATISVSAQTPVGTVPVSIAATNAIGTAAQTLSIVINSAPTTAPATTSPTPTTTTPTTTTTSTATTPGIAIVGGGTTAPTTTTAPVYAAPTSQHWVVSVIVGNLVQATSTLSANVGRIQSKAIWLSASGLAQRLRATLHLHEDQGHWYGTVVVADRTIKAKTLRLTAISMQKTVLTAQATGRVHLKNGKTRKIVATISAVEEA